MDTRDHRAVPEASVPSRESHPTWWERHAHRGMHHPLRRPWLWWSVAVLCGGTLGAGLAALHIPQAAQLPIVMVVVVPVATLLAPRLNTPPVDAPIRSVDLDEFVTITRAVQRSRCGRRATLPSRLHKIALAEVARGTRPTRWVRPIVIGLTATGPLAALFWFSRGDLAMTLIGVVSFGLLLGLLVHLRRVAQRTMQIPRLLRPGPATAWPEPDSTPPSRPVPPGEPSR